MIVASVVIIPARFHSTRFPGKVLVPLNGKPLIQHVYEKASGAARADAVYVATDHRGVVEAVEAFGGRAVMTAEGLRSGTDRIAEALGLLEARGGGSTPWDVIVNVQGDEPLVRADMVDALVDLMADRRASIGTLAKRIEDVEDITNPNTVKVVFDREGFALYFSRSPIPYYRDLFAGRDLAGTPPDPAAAIMFRHVGLYAYRREALLKFTSLPVSRLEEAEKLEQLRALEHGLAIKVGETAHATIGVDTPEDLERVQQCISSSS